MDCSSNRRHIADPANRDAIHERGELGRFRFRCNGFSPIRHGLAFRARVQKGAAQILERPRSLVRSCPLVRLGGARGGYLHELGQLNWPRVNDADRLAGETVSQRLSAPIGGLERKRKS